MIFRIVYKSGQIFLPCCRNSRVWHTDRQRDGRTDRILIARPRLHSMQRGKNSNCRQTFLWIRGTEMSPERQQTDVKFTPLLSTAHNNLRNTIFTQQGIYLSAPT